MTCEQDNSFFYNHFHNITPINADDESKIIYEQDNIFFL